MNEIKPSPKLLDLLVCPLSKSSLTHDEKNNRLISHQAKLFYPIRDGIPVLLPEEAMPIEKTY